MYVICNFLLCQHITYLGVYFKWCILKFMTLLKEGKEEKWKYEVSMEEKIVG